MTVFCSNFDSHVCLLASSLFFRAWCGVQEYRPAVLSSIKFDKFTFGDVPATVEGVKVYDTGNEGSVEADIFVVRRHLNRCSIEHLSLVLQSEIVQIRSVFHVCSSSARLTCASSLYYAQYWQRSFFVIHRIWPRTGGVCRGRDWLIAPYRWERCQ